MFGDLAKYNTFITCILRVWKMSCLKSPRGKGYLISSKGAILKKRQNCEKGACCAIFLVFLSVTIAQPVFKTKTNVFRYITARSDRYNIMYWDEPFVGDYFWTIKRAFHHFIEAYDIKIKKPL